MNKVIAINREEPIHVMTSFFSTFTDESITLCLHAMQKDVFNIQASRGLAQAFIIDGKVLQKSLKLLGKDVHWVIQTLETQNISNVEDVFFAQIDQLGNIYIDKREDIVK
jgi:uncharacterized membrane protein YcaP (DUF421 family)